MPRVVFCLVLFFCCQTATAAADKILGADGFDGAASSKEIVANNQDALSERRGVTVGQITSSSSSTFSLCPSSLFSLRILGKSSTRPLASNQGGWCAVLCASTRIGPLLFLPELGLVCFPLLRHFKSAPVYSHKSQEEARLQQCHGLTPPCLSLSPNAAWCTSILLWRLHLGRGRRDLYVARASRLRIELPGHPEL